MKKRKHISHQEEAWLAVRQDVQKLARQADQALRKRHTMSSGDKVEVDYFALLHVLEHMSESIGFYRDVARAKEIMDR